MQWSGRGTTPEIKGWRWYKIPRTTEEIASALVADYQISHPSLESVLANSIDYEFVICTSPNIY